ncbi:phage portal protein [Methylobacterium oryzihabitans]|uniref:Phage portal protein n=1 Tax=Methylobacterium oryzihabitans TaxID=2499852 RepID=A0A3S2VU26_9HYPH|nr:phage portal protein [Methylobacterium oryzihabitans]RVU17488.1 phage portal protein [Methylobacterium oryzihabitans]
MRFWRRSARAADRPRVEPTVEASTTFLSSDAEAWNDALPGGLGASVSPATAMRHAAVYRCVSILAFASAMLPLKTYRELPGGDREPSSDHPAADLLRVRPNPRLSRTMWLRTTVAQMLLQGNAVSWIERKGSGDPVALWPIPFERVAIDLAGERLRYRLGLDDGTGIVVDQDDVLHIPGSPQWTGVKALSPIQAMAAAVGLGIEADRFAQSYFENDAAPTGYITYPDKYSGDKDELRKFWVRTFGKGNRGKGPAVLDQSGKYERIPISAQDAQLLDTRRFQIEDIARIFGVPRFLMGMDETSWGSGIEALGIGFVTYTLDPHLCAIEDEVNHKLYGRGRPSRPGPNPTRYLGEFDRDVLVRGNIESRFKAYGTALGGSAGPGFMTPNEVRRRQNLPARPDGDGLSGWVAKAAGPTDPQQDPTRDAPPADPAQ